MNIFSQFAVILLLALVGLSFVLFSRDKRDRRVISADYEPYCNSDAAQRYRPQKAESRKAALETESGATMILPALYMEQLDPATMKMVQRFEITNVPSMGIAISRPNAVHGDIKLNASVKAAFSVSENHARIGRDEQGFFIQDQKNDGRMRLGKTKMVVEEADITNGLILYLGIQPLRFVIPDFWCDSSNDDEKTILYDGVMSEKHERREARFARRHDGNRKG